MGYIVAFLLFSDGCLRVSVRYLLRKPDGSFYYQRRVPSDLRGHYGNLTFIRKSLKTHDPAEAAKEASRQARVHDALWQHLRSPQAKDLKLTTAETRDAAKALLETLGLEPGTRRNPDGSVRADFDLGDVLEEHIERRIGSEWSEARHDPHSYVDPGSLLSPVEHEAYRLLDERPEKPRVLLSDALAVYLNRHNRGNDPAFRVFTQRAIQLVFDAAGDLPLEAFTRANARTVQDVIAQGRRTATVRRRLDTIAAVFAVGIRELSPVHLPNHFAKLDIAREGEDSRKRLPFTNEELQTIAAACCQRSDNIRWLIAMQIETGARLGEVVGLRVSDVFLSDSVPHLWIKEHRKLGRSLKTPGSVRRVPLVGVSLWAAQEALKAAQGVGAGWLFPRYASDGLIRATHASNTINKWLRGLAIDKTTHSARHALRDRLRAVGCPEAVMDAIGGWISHRSVGQGYGQGYSLEVLKGWLDKVVLE